MKTNTSFIRRGTVSIETAISFGLVLLLTASLLTFISVYETDMLMQAATDQVCEDLSFVMPFSVTSSDLLSTMINALPDGTIDESAGEVLSVAGTLDQITGGAVSGGIADLVMEDTLANDIASEFEERKGGDGLFAPLDIDVDLIPIAEECVIEVDVEYEITTMVGPVRRSIVSYIPFYGDFSLFLNGVTGEEYEDNIWDRNNFDRGLFFQELYGGDLPPTFPVINSFEDGTATSITSIDVNKPTYSDLSVLGERLDEEISALSGFDGASRTISGRTYTVSGNDIMQRQLIVVVPENISDEALEILDLKRQEATLSGVIMKIERYGTSG